MLDPYPFQKAAVDHAINFFNEASTGDKQLYAAPTGVGKSIIELLVQQRFADCWIVTPRQEIIDGMFAKGAIDRISTPIKLRNRLLDGTQEPPGKLIWDESHHQTADSYQQIELLTGLAPAIGYTATPYRGSPRSTAEFLKHWGEPLWLITYREAAQMGYISVPRYNMLPLVDDDEIEIVNGEFVVESCEEKTIDRLDDLANHCKQWYSDKWDRPTIFAFPSSKICHEFARRMPAVRTVSAETPPSERTEIFAQTVSREVALAHINVVTEGVDLPLRRLVDCSPMMSPVKWLQQLGRITRPTTERPEYICTNRNLLRHAYLLDGLVPPASIAEAEQILGHSERATSHKSIGLEAIGRFKPSTVKTVSGITCHVYCMSVVHEDKVVEYAALAHPAYSPMWAVRVHTKKEDGTRDWGKWVPSEAPESLRGFSSIPAREISEKQRAWWKRSATTRGVVGDPDRKSFVVLPLLFDLNMRLS